MTEPTAASHKDAIHALCLAMQDAGIPFEASDESVVAPAQSDFLTRCCDTYASVAKWQTPRHGHPRLWQPDQLRHIADYAGRHVLQVLMLAPDHPSALAENAFAVSGTTLLLGMAALSPTAEQMAWGLEHERGHVRDTWLVGARDPALARTMREGRHIRQETEAIADLLLILLYEQVPAAERVWFGEQANAIFGDWSSLLDAQLMTVANLLCEVVRLGEELPKPGWRALVMDPEFRHLTTKAPVRAVRGRLGLNKPDSTWVDLQYLLLTAQLQEAGLWEQFVQRPDFAPQATDHLDPDHLRFFRMALRAARHLTT